MSFTDGPPSVRAPLSYVYRTEKRPYVYMVPPPGGVPPVWGEIHVADVPVHDARQLPQAATLARQGFELRLHQTAVTDFYDPEQITGIYYPEIEQLLGAMTGADKILIFDHTIRSIPRLRAGMKNMREPARYIHNDYTEASGPERVRNHLAPEEAEWRLKHRFFEMNVWRPIRGPLEDSPLAVCDASTVAPDDLMVCDLIYADRITETYSVISNPDHRWYYYPRMQQNEALIFKGFDSDKTSRTRFTPHTAFEDPTAPVGRLERESIEVRALIFLPPG
ncbi:MAG TPA: CmcJ/NvfI family oxidoreductase [Rhizomicrobium sp.]